MANMMTGKSHLHKKYRLFQTLSILGFLLGITALILHIPLKGMLMPLFPIGFITGGVLNNKAHMIKRGLEGEQYASKLLPPLPSSPEEVEKVVTLLKRIA